LLTPTPKHLTWPFPHLLSPIAIPSNPTKLYFPPPQRNRFSHQLSSVAFFFHCSSHGLLVSSLSVFVSFRHIGPSQGDHADFMCHSHISVLTLHGEGSSKPSLSV
jgi:hypothetical protein